MTDKVPPCLSNPLQVRPDPVIHAAIRLSILSALAVGETLSFGELKRIINVTDGNLSTHARKLENAGYIVCMKSFHNRTPRTEFRLTAPGREALLDYFQQMEQVLQLTRDQIT